MPTVSIAIPTYNSALFLKEAIESVMRQGLEDFEIVVSDNASDDDTEGMIGRLANPHLRYVRSERNLGASANLARCLQLAQGEYVKVLCADDVLVGEVIKKQVAVLRDQPHTSLVTCDMIVTDSELRPTSLERFFPGKQPGWRLKALCLGTLNNYIGGPSNFMFRRKDAQDLSYDAGYRWISDLKFGLQLLERGDYVNIGEPGYLYRRHAGAYTSVGCPENIRLPEFLRLADELNEWNLFTCAQTLRRGGRQFYNRAGSRAFAACAPTRLRPAGWAAAGLGELDARRGSDAAAGAAYSE